MKKIPAIMATCLFIFSLINCSGDLQTGNDIVKSRTIVTSDGEVDDMDSFIRLLLYANEFDIEGLVYSSSQWHYAGDGKGTFFTSPTNPRYGERTDLRWPGTDWMEGFISEYALVYDNLLEHDKDYPTPDYLQGIVKIGNIEFEGEMEKETEGSEWIKSVLLDDEPGLVYLQIWGGTNTVARALKSIQETYEGTEEWDEIYTKVSEKAVIYTVLDQDITYKEYVAPNWPDIRVIYNSAQFWSFAYMWPMVVPDQIKPFMSGPWYKENILFNHGPLLEQYFTWGDGKKIKGDPEHTQGDTTQLNRGPQRQTKYSFISEGDSPAYFFMLNYGLRSKEDPSYGGLGGRFVQSESNPKRWEDGQNVTDLNPFSGREETSYPQVRWIETLQNDFAARADWCVSEYSDANHAPVVALKGGNDIIVKPGDKVDLSALVSDPDGDEITYLWWQYKEAGSYPGEIEISGNTGQEASVTVPDDAESGQTIHIILEAGDSGEPKLTRYQRAILTVE